MRLFEVTVPPLDGHGAPLRMEIRADHWVGAWKQALTELGDQDIDPESISCRIGDDGAVEVTAGDQGRRLYVRSKGPGETLETASAESEAEPSIVVPTDLREASRRKTARDDPQLLQTMVGDPLSADTAQDVPAAPAQSAPRARIKRKRAATGRRPGQVGSAVGSRVPYAPSFDGGYTTTTREALDMLGRHVRAEATQYLVPGEAEGDWRVESARGSMSQQVDGSVLRAKEAVPGAVERGAGRRTFAGDGVRIRYSRGLGRRVAFNVKSALWAPVQRDQEVVGLLLLLNARRGGGFSDADLSAVNELARLLSQRNGQ